MKLPELVIGGLKASVPIIQGGMGIGISLHKLASAVANQGGIGVISAAQVGFLEKDFHNNNLEANLRSLKKEIRLARKNSPKGILGVNLMMATNYYEEYVRTIVEEKIDIIISGAGLPLDLPKLVQGSSVKIAPIVSSAKAAKVICKSWDRKYHTCPDLIIVEGPMAGGHLGFHKEDISNSISLLDEIAVDVKDSIQSYGKKYNKYIPVVAAGGVFDGNDIARLLNLGLDGVQIGTRFVATEECDANYALKEAYVNAKKEDIQIVSSPVGMPGRAVRNKFIEDIEKNPQNVKCLYNCLKPCNPSSAPYCISQALINATLGNIDEGLIFAGSNVYKINEIVSVKDLMIELINDAEIKFKGKLN
ncbi:nitronate monooxygenase [Clostridium botulinum C]|uniref:NAD(P)H-dependent flavin oxidoreductase n=1 Tax=Clostridium botulinum TaxID=1491 RepID=UPI001E3C5374|nr:nitronate monooxygenase family protein [Clostridium botulinum]MCD3246672.1 nitronate monooxygenase [Clostridium botulinum C]MCD3262973.1 nitronate monooxygenase [Clostridium botulinum C]